jgi:hypothetical protein
MSDIKARTGPFTQKQTGPLADGETEYSPNPSPAEILKPRFTVKNYQGLKVAWKVNIRNIHAEISQNEIMVLTSFENTPGKIYIIVDVDKFPKILRCPSGREITVKGEIGSVQEQDINLKNCLIEF